VIKSVKPHQLIAELMTFSIFANINQTIEPISSKIMKAMGRSEKSAVKAPVFQESNRRCRPSARH
jgi:hypothetical protein